MGTGVTIRYDQPSDTLYIDTVPPYAEQDSDEIDDTVIARMNPDTGAVENLAVLFWSGRIAQGKPLHLPVAMTMRCTSLTAGQSS